MSCLPDCNCAKSVEQTDSVEEVIAHVEPSYHPLETYVSEAIPLLPKDTAMLCHESNIEHYELLAVIGQGFSNAVTISLARHVPSVTHVAIRRINLDKCKEEIDYVQREILYIRQLRHENILPYLCTFVCDNEVWAIMPLMTYGSTKSLMKSHFHDGFPEIAISLIAKDILLALEYLHRRGFIHRSIKASHVLISGQGRALLTGLRYSCNVLEKGRWQNNIHAFPHDSVPNLNWLSPELLAQNLLGYNAKSDIYSLGMTIWELSNGITPFFDMSPTQMLLEKLDGNIIEALEFHTAIGNGSSPGHQNTENHKLPQPQGNLYLRHQYSESFQSFIQLCLQKDPYCRPTAAQLRTHSYIKQGKKSQISLLDVLAIVTPLAERLANSEAETKDVDLDKLEGLEINDTWSF